MAQLISRQGERLVMPGMASAHSHAFQRALRGRTQRRSTQAGSFWSWRGLMYDLVTRLDPDDVYHLSRLAFAELAMSGVTAVGEFHYVHHAPGGKTYDDRVLLAEKVIAAAREAGIRLTLIRTAYLRAGFGQTLAPAQARFCDATIDQILQDVDTLRQRHRDDPMVEVALAAHSIRAVPLAQLRELVAYARRHEMPFHLHVAEQRREVEECLQEYRCRPVELLARNDLLDDRLVAVHATHLADGEIEALGKAQAMICLCRTTERDLGDGLPRTADLIAAGARLCVGVDSHASSDAFEEIRAVELDERSRTESRHVAAEAPALLRIATDYGYRAIGMAGRWQQDKVYLNAADPSLAGVADDLSADAIIFGATPRAVDQVTVAGKQIVSDGIHCKYPEALQGFRVTLRKLGLG